MVESPQIIWDIGSAYDLFISLYIIHKPEDFGLRPSWAAGVRSRLPLPLREVLEQTQKFLYIPMNWVYSLPSPKNAQTALEALKALVPKDRLPALMFTGKADPETTAFYEFLLSLEGKTRFTTQIESRILAQKILFPPQSKGSAKALFSAWADRKVFGEKLIEALEAFINNFFREEEARIIPAMEQALAEAQTLAQTHDDIMSLLEQLSTGVRLDWVGEARKVILAPSFWSAPYLLADHMPEDTQIVLYGSRPSGLALVPGGQVTEEMLYGLKALADPTRLRLLKHLMQESYTVSELAKALRLRPPTVIHHLQSLRLAGFVLVTISSNTERRYEVRRNGLVALAKQVKTFFEED